MGWLADKTGLDKTRRITFILHRCRIFAAPPKCLPGAKPSSTTIAA